MKSRLRKGMTIKSEIKPLVGLLNPAFVYQRESNLREKFVLIRERQAADAKQHTVIQLRKTK